MMMRQKKMMDRYDDDEKFIIKKRWMKMKKTVISLDYSKPNNLQKTDKRIFFFFFAFYIKKDTTMNWDSITNFRNFLLIMIEDSFISSNFLNSNRYYYYYLSLKKPSTIYSNRSTTHKQSQRFTSSIRRLFTWRLHWYLIRYFIFYPP
jgi:hypothetical protein